ncbi:MAG: hypothetical protein WBF03_22465 [Xanthobacteraceae bacterium]
MAISKTDMHKEYERFAALCLKMVAVTQDPESRAIQRMMAAEWMKLADAIEHSSKHQQPQMQ